MSFLALFALRGLWKLSLGHYFFESGNHHTLQLGIEKLRCQKKGEKYPHDLWEERNLFEARLENAVGRHGVRTIMESPKFMDNVGQFLASELSIPIYGTLYPPRELISQYVKQVDSEIVPYLFKHVRP